GTATANELITVTAVNDTPVAVNDLYTINENTTVTLNPLALDTDLDGDTLSITSINGTTLTGGAQTITVTNGTVNISTVGVITFTPSANFNSATAISIPYVISDGHGGTATANELITVNAVNDNPTAVDDLYTINEDTTLTLNPLALDTTVYEALKVMGEKNIGAILVIDGSDLKGILSERDYARKIVLKDKSSKETFVHEIMESTVFSVKLSNNIEDCMELMSTKRIRHLPVLENEIVVGIISISDVVKAIIEIQKDTINHLNSYISQ
ncbi:Ig-like domain-containing protein, partial [Flavobacterium sp. LBUM151]